jgi:hypothetical protein
MDSAGDRIRVMTVHGAKGLQSPVVILPETGTWRAAPTPQIITAGAVPLWTGPASEMPEVIGDAVAGARTAQEAERDRLLELLAAADGASLILSGDRHRAGLYRMETADGVPLREATSSSLNRPIPGMAEEAGPRRIGPTFTGTNYGMVEVDWESGTVRVEVRAAADGEPVLSQAFPLSG